MGFASSYQEVQKLNVACSLAPDVLGSDMDILGQTLLFAGDNVDHNIITLDGKGIFNGMGMIATITPGKQVNHGIPQQKMPSLKLVKITKSDCRSHTHLMSVITRTFWGNCLLVFTTVCPVGKT